jgi:hypothetical protein
MSHTQNLRNTSVNVGALLESYFCESMSFIFTLDPFWQGSFRSGEPFACKTLYLGHASGSGLRREFKASKRLLRAEQFQWVVKTLPSGITQLVKTGISPTENCRRVEFAANINTLWRSKRVFRLTLTLKDSFWWSNPRFFGSQPARLARH